MAGKQIVALDAQTPQRTDLVAQQDSTGTQPAQKSTIAELLALIETSDIADLPTVLADYQLLAGKDAANGYAGLNASAKLPAGSIDQASATTGQALLWSGSAWAPGDVATNLDQQAIFVSKAGNDSNDGLTANKAKLTISAAITAANSAGYGLVWVYDAGTYAEGVTNIDGIDLYAPNATLDLGSSGDQLRLAEQRTVLKAITRTSGGNSAVFNDASGGTSELVVERIVDSGSGVTVRNTFTTTLILYANIIDVQGSGIALADFTNSGHIHAWISDIYLRSNGATGIQRSNAGLTVATVQHILLKDAATGTVAIDCNAGTLDCNVLEISCATAYDVASGATLNLFCNDINGTQTNAGTTNLVALNSDSSLGGDLTCVDLNATNGVVDTITVDGSELDPTGHTAGQVLQSDGTDFVPTDLTLLANVVINPDFAIVQRQATPGTLTTYNDGTYSADRWILLTQDANGQFARTTGDTQRYAGQLKKTAAGTTRLGAIQWVEGQNCRHLRGQTVTLQLRIRCSESGKTIRCGIIESTKTEDTITRDAISDWTTTPVSLIADYAFAGTPGSVVSDTNWQTLSYTVTLGSSFNNLAVLIWSETGLSQNATLDIEAVKLAPGSQPAAFVPRSVAFEDVLCKRYFERETGSGFYYFAPGFVAAAGAAFFAYRYAPKRAVPTFNTTALATFGVIDGVTLRTAGSITFQFATERGCRIQVGATLSAPAATAFLCNNTTAYLEIDAEL